MAKTSNPIIVRAGMTIGSISAETDDDFLFDCFVTNPAVTTSENVQAPGRILSGRTGSGKTAIVRHLSRTEENVVTIDPFDMALSYVSNSDILLFLQSIGADLDLLFQILWKHVLCIEFIRLRFHVNDAKKSQNVFQKLFDSVGNDPRKKKSVEYLRAWEGRFFITMDQNVKDITDKYVTDLTVDLKANVPGIIKGGATYDRQISQETKQQVIQRTKQIINADQLAELSGVIDILSEQSEGDKVKYYIVIDQLDERWIDDVMRFRLVRALIESLKPFRKIPNLKILIALRSDILERVMLETKDLGFQREKYQEYFIELNWRRSELKELVQKRIGLLFKKKYTGSTVKFEDIFNTKVGESEPFDYMLHRTLKRPRDIISFVNECLKKAEGQPHITARFVREAEKQYSRIRMAALEDEWRSTFPSLARLLNFLSRRRPSVPMSELWDDEAALELALGIVTDPDMSRDPLTRHAGEAIDSTSPKALQAFLQHTVANLYRVGAVGVKLQAHERFQYSDTDSPILTPEQLTADVPVRVHLMLHQALNIRRRGRREFRGVKGMEANDPRARSVQRILLAEDDDDMRRFLVKALEKANYDVVSFGNGLEAYERLKEEPFMLLLTDIVMPEMDGIELARKASELDPDLKIMFITGFAAVALNPDNNAPKDAKILSKPFHLRDLVDEVERMLAA